MKVKIVELVMIALLAGVVTSIAQPPAAPASSRKFMILEETKSPDGSTAIGWSLPKHPKIWSQVIAADEKNEEAVLDEVFVVADDVENHLVDLKTQSSMRKVDSKYWCVRNIRPNRHHLEVEWSEDGNLVLVNHTYRWGCIGFCAAHVADGRVTHFGNLKKALTTTVRKRLIKLSKDVSSVAENSVALSFSSLDRADGGGFQVTAEGIVPSKGEDSWSGEANVRFTLEPGKKQELVPKNLTIERKN